MKSKILVITFLIMIFLTGIVISGGLINSKYIGIIENPSGINISNFIAGTVTSANFSFDYIDSYCPNEQYPLIFKINISYNGTEEECSLKDCSVLKGDFEIDGFLRRYYYPYYPYLFYKDIKLECSEKSPLIINSQLGSEILDVSDGTFYCYNLTEGTIENLRKRNKIFLNISSNPALYPGKYRITAEMFYINDTQFPIVNIINKEDFNRYYRELDNIEVQANIGEINPKNYWGTIFTDSEEIIIPYSHKNNLIYYFTKILPLDLDEGDYPLYIFAEDENGNRGHDSTILKIDRTSPEIELVEPTEIVSEEFSIKFRVTDEKSGVNKTSVKCRLREILNEQICPETGGYLGNGETPCITTSWINLYFNESSDLFEIYIDSSEYNSGEYWLEAKAEDLLGNKAEWVAD